MASYKVDIVTPIREVKLDNVGDFILWVDLAYSIRNFHKKEHITLYKLLSQAIKQAHEKKL